MSQTIVRAATHGKGRAALVRALNNRQSFVTSGALSGRAYDEGQARLMLGTHPGELSGADLDAWRRDADAVTFVVLSYSTPIGWIVADGSDRGRFHRVEQRFSNTTSRHQGTLYAVEMPAGHFDTLV